MCVNPYHISIAVRELDLFLANFIHTSNPDAQHQDGDEAGNDSGTFFYCFLFDFCLPFMIPFFFLYLLLSKFRGNNTLMETFLGSDTLPANEGIWGTGVFTAYELKTITRRRSFLLLFSLRGLI